jgi:hypothetical protein
VEGDKHMSVLNNTNSDAFAPYRGSDAAIRAFPVTNGSVYFAYDTKKIYFDMEGVRHTMSGDGIHFVYGNGTKIQVNPNTNLYDFPRIAIDAEHYMADDIIINADGVFYRIIALNDTYAECERLLVSGSGGSTGTPSNVMLNIIEPFRGSIPYGQAAVGKFKVFDSMGGINGTLEIIYKDNNSEDTQPRYSEKISFIVGEEFPVTLKAENLKPGAENYIILQAEVDRARSNVRTATINCV